MSNVLLPTLAGLTWNTTKTPVFSTITQRAVDMSELRGSFSAAPVYEFTRSYDLLRDNVANNELKTLMGFFMSRLGSWDSWLYADPDDSAAVGMNFGYGVGDGVTVTFQLTRTLGGFTEPVCNVLAGANIYNNAVLQTLGVDYNFSNTAVVTFANAPAANVPLTWTGTYYHRCRFKEDQQEFRQFMSKLWDARSFEFTGTLGSKL